MFLPQITDAASAQEVLSRVDGVFVTGGEDWNPKLYNQEAIDPEHLAEGLTVVAKSSDGIIEAVEYQANRFALGLQWHPERDALSDTRFTDVSQDLSNLPLRALVKHAADYAAQ